MRVDRSRLLECFFVSLIQIAIEDVSAQTAMPELRVRQARQIFVGGRLGVFVGACLQPRVELAAHQFEPGESRRPDCPRWRHFRWTESVVHGYNRSREEGALEPAMGEGLWCEGACKSRRLLCSKTRPPRVWARATKGRPSEHALTSSALRTRARGPIAAHPAPILGPPAPDRWPDPGHSYARARDMGLMPPYARPRAAREQLRTEFAQHAFRTTHVREGPIRRRLR